MEVESVFDRNALLQCRRAALAEIKSIMREPAKRTDALCDAILKTSQQDTLALVLKRLEADRLFLRLPEKDLASFATGFTVTMHAFALLRKANRR